MTTPIPCIEVRPDPAAFLGGDGDDLLASMIAFFAAPRNRSDERIAKVISTLIDEGRRFRETESGRRWTAVLSDSKFVSNGWMVWNMLDLDRFARAGSVVAEADTPSAMLEDLIRQVSAMPLEQLVTLLSAYSMDRDKHD